MIEIDEDFWVRPDAISAMMWFEDMSVTIWLPSGPVNVKDERAKEVWRILASEDAA